MGSGFLDGLMQTNAQGNQTRPVTGDSQSSRLTVTLNEKATSGAEQSSETNGVSSKLKENHKNGKNLNGSAQIGTNLITEQLNKLQQQANASRPEPDPNKPPEPADTMVVKYMQENEGLRSENAQLHIQSEQMMMDLEEMNRENERLKRKLSIIKPNGVSRSSSTELTAEHRLLQSILKEQDEDEEQSNEFASLDQVKAIPSSLIQNKNGTFKLRKSSAQTAISTDNSSTSRVSTAATRSKTNAVNLVGLELHGKSAISSSRFMRK